tara:strand:+ start:2450 stop:2713 length:264 start_codon:yes stop_codon:yes gene_type:complete
MCLPSPKIPDASAQIEAQQKALQAEKDDAAAKDMAFASAEAKRQQKLRRGRASLITQRGGGSNSLGILGDSINAPLGSSSNQLTTIS